MAVNDGYLRSIPSDTDQDDGRLYDPTAADSSGAAEITGVGGIASAEAIGQPAISLVVLPVSIASLEAIGSPDVAASVGAAGIAGAEVFGQPAVSAVIIPAGIASAEAIGQPSVAATIQAVAIAGVEAFGQPSISAGINAAGITSLEAVGQPSVSVTIGAAGIPSTESFGLPTVSTTAAQDITGVGGIGSLESFGQPTIQAVTIPPEATSMSGGGGSFNRMDADLALEFERISIEGERAAKRASQPKQKRLVDAVAKAINPEKEITQARDEAARQEALQAAAMARLKESEALAAKAIEDARQSAIDGYNALMLALVMLDED
jgi:hypothetical protein